MEFTLSEVQGFEMTDLADAFAVISSEARNLSLSAKKYAVKGVNALVDSRDSNHAQR
jgi:hypothetical protein